MLLVRSDPLFVATVSVWFAVVAAVEWLSVDVMACCELVVVT
jgi:hypothetical protein